MTDGLERAERTPELLARLDVLDRHLHRCLAHSDELAGGKQRSDLPVAAGHVFDERRGPQRTAALDREEHHLEGAADGGISTELGPAERLGLAPVRRLVRLRVGLHASHELDRRATLHEIARRSAQQILLRGQSEVHLASR